MVYIHPDVTKAAIICDLEYNNQTGVGKVMHKDGFPIGKEVTIYCTTVEEFTILKHLGYKARLNEHPSDATMNGVDVPEEDVTKVGTSPFAPLSE